MNPEKSIAFRIAGACGILAILTIIIAIIFPMSTADWFSFTDHAFSDLGVHSEQKEFFQYGMMLAGVFTLIFSGGLYNYLNNKRKIVGAAFFIGGIGLIGVGLHPEGLPHIAAVLLMLVSLCIGLFILASGVNLDKYGKMAGLVLIAGIVSIGLLYFFSGFAPTELVIFLGIGILIFVFSIDLIRKGVDISPKGE